MYKRDVCIILTVLAVGFLLLGVRYFFQRDNEGYYAEISHINGMIRVPLHVNNIFTVSETLPTVIFEVRAGQIAFIASDCPDQLCVQSGFLHRAGQMAACLPNGLILRIPSDDDIDMIIR